jgi:hypothetical protein
VGRGEDRTGAGIDICPGDREGERWGASILCRWHGNDKGSQAKIYLVYLGISREFHRVEWQMISE